MSSQRLSCARQLSHSQLKLPTQLVCFSFHIATHALPVLTLFLVNISSTMWSIIEQNLAIICTCLPMCRLPIATRFPLWVSESELTARDVSEPADLSKRQTRRWSPYTGPRNVQGITRSIVITSDEMSDELTLDPVERTFTMSTLSSDIGAIRKIVEYEITFETASEAEP